MASTTTALHLQPLTSHNQTLSHTSFTNPHFRLYCRRNNTPLVHLQKGKNSMHEARTWGVNARGGMVMGDYDDDIDEDDDDDDEEEEDEDRSLDLLIRFVENVFRKVLRNARRAVKSVLPVPISTRLVMMNIEHGQRVTEDA